MSFDAYEKQLLDLESKGLKREIFDKDAFRGENWSSNDYLGLSTHPAVVRAAGEALAEFGAGGASSRLLAGTHRLHQQFENDVAAFLGKEAALLFSSGYHTNTGLIPALAGTGDVLFVDHLCHASLIDGMRLSGARFYTFEHNNTDHLSELLTKKRADYKNALIVTEGVFSMDGDAPDINALADLAARHNALLYVDEAHSFGVFGRGGRGVADEQKALERIDIFVGTLSKSLGSQGGFVATKKRLIEFLTTRTRSFIYTTALAPANVGAGLAALRLLPSLDDRRAVVRSGAADLIEALRALGCRVLPTSSQIVPVWTGDVAVTKKMSDYLFQRGFFVPSIRPPTVPVGEGRVRLSVTYDAAQRGFGPLLTAFENYLVQTH